MKNVLKFTVTLSSIAIAVLFVGGESAFAQGGDTVGRSQFRRLVDPSERSVVGTLVLTKKGNEQTVEISLLGLTQESLASYFSLDATPPFQPQNFTNYFLNDIAPVGRINEKKGNWFSQLIGIGEASPLIPYINDLDQAAGHSIALGRIDDNKLIVGVTNVIGNTTNVVIGLPFPLPNKTNTISALTWAPFPVMSADPASLSYSRKGTLLPPIDNPPAPKAKATLRYKYTGTTGRSVFDLRATGMPGGQIPHVFISTTTNFNVPYELVDVGTLTMSRNGTAGRYVRDTQFGDPLPLQVANSGDLSGRLIQILDLNGSPPFIYVQGIIP